MTLMMFARFEQPLKWLAFGLGLGSAIAVVQGWQLAAMLLSLPFCLIWIYCGWLRNEPQLKYINMMFAALYVYGLVRYFLING
ncbi:peptidase [Paramylibacter kogurei]|nr:peptidase [Amylibacter kogurei]